MTENTEPDFTPSDELLPEAVRAKIAAETEAAAWAETVEDAAVDAEPFIHEPGESQLEPEPTPDDEEMI